MKFFVLGIAVLMYAFVIAFQDKKVFFTSAAALLLLVLGAVFPGAIFSGTRHADAFLHALSSLVNWNVLLIYLGSMMIAALFIYSKVPSRIADFIIEKSPKTGIAIVLILAMTGIISIFVENVATVLVMTPIALVLCKKLKLNPTNFLLGLAVMSNLEGTATLVGDPPSMIFASYAGYTFNDFFVHEGKISIFFFIQIGLVVGCVFFYLFFRNENEKVQVEKTKIVSVFPAALLLAMIFGLAAISFTKIELPFFSGAFVFLLGAAGVVWFVANQKKSWGEAWQMIRELDWETIFFLTGIFVVVGALSESGLLFDFAQFLRGIIGGSRIAGFLLILLVSVILSGFIDNVPYIIVMLPVADSLARSIDVSGELFMFALLIGSCLGGNLTPYGASANVAAMGILKKEGCPMDFGGWLKLGAPFTLCTTAAAAAALWAIWA
ncbi:MAG: citrate transporter [Treponema sp.]|nr:citrate transporter [Treponema sp.]